MARILASLLVGLSIALCSSAFALGLGAIESRSALNQHLSAEIPLYSIAPGDLKRVTVTLASAEAFERAGVERPFYLADLDFTVVQGERPHVLVSSRRPVREPFLNFLIEVNWPNGRMIREYTLLLDPPTFASETAAAPAAAVSQPPTTATRRAAAAGTAASLAPAPRTAAAEPRPATQEQQPSVRTSGTLPAEYVVRPDQTLWGIGRQLSEQGSVNIYQTLLGLIRANPDAFLDGDINRLQRGSILRVPDRAELEQVPPSAAIREVQRLMAQRPQPGRQVASQPTPKPATGRVEGRDSGMPPAQTAAQPRDGRLKVVAANESATDLAAGGALLDDDLRASRDNVERLQEEVTNLQDSRLNLASENQELRQQLTALKEEVSRLERLVNLKAQSGGATNDQAAAQQNAPQAADKPASSAADSAPQDQKQAQKPTEETAQRQPTPKPAPQPEVEEPREIILPGGIVIPIPNLSSIPGYEAVTNIIATLPPVEVSNLPFYEQLPPEVQVLLNDSRTLAMLGGAVLVLLLLVMLAVRRARQLAGSPVSIRIDGADKAGDSLLDDDDDSLEVDLDDENLDPLAEAENQISYGRYDQAERILLHAVERHPEDVTMRAKLLDVLALTQNRGAFESHAEILHAQVDPDDSIWERVAAMGREIAPEHPLFADEGEVALDDSADSLLDDDVFNTAATPGATSTDPPLDDDVNAFGDSDDLLASAGSADDGDNTLGNSASFDDSDDLLGGSGSLDVLGGDSSDDSLDIGGSDSEGEFAGLLDSDDSGLSFDSQTDDVAGESPEFAATGDADDNGLDFDINLGKNDFGGDAAGEAESAGLTTADSDSNGLEFDLDLDTGTDLDGDDPADLALTADSSDEGGLEFDGDFADLGDLQTSTSGDGSSSDDDDGLPLGDFDTDDDFGSLNFDSGTNGDDDAGDVALATAETATLETDDDFGLDGFESADTTALISGDDDLAPSDDEDELDEVTTKLDLARAYRDMGDAEGARSLLEEVVDEGSDSQKKQARSLLADIA